MLFRSRLRCGFGKVRRYGSLGGRRVRDLNLKYPWRQRLQAVAVADLVDQFSQRATTELRSFPEVDCYPDRHPACAAGAERIEAPVACLNLRWRYRMADDLDRHAPSAAMRTVQNELRHG